MTKIILALAAIAATGRALEPPRRRLRDTVDMTHIKEQAEASAFTGSLSFKLDAGAADEKGADELADQVAGLISCSSAKRVFRPAGKHEAKHVAKGLNLWYAVKCAADDESALEASLAAASKLEAYLQLSDEDHAGVAIVEPGLVATASWTPNDPQYGDQAGHYDAVNLAQAWDTTKGNPNVVVQVLDTGLDLDHPDLQLNIWRNTGETDCTDGVDNDNNGFVDDCHGYNHADDTAGDASSGNYLGAGSHGSHCGGTVAADTNNDVGVSGVAGGDGTADSGAKLMVSVGFGQTSTGGFAEALVYGADNGAQISSNSWGYISSGVVEQAVLDAIDYYTDSASDGGEGIEGIVVFAAGNDNSNADYYPGFYDKTVAVAATDNSGTRASFSNYGDWIDISAPGVSILSTIIGGYSRYSGTSMACPHVAGILALCLSADPSLGRQDALDRLYATASPLTADLGAGMADAEAFVAQCANGAPTAKPTVSMRPTTAVPTPKPTVSVAPTRSCACEQALTITVVTDNYPGETAWSLTMENPGQGCHDASQDGGGYDSAGTEYVDEIPQICAGQEYCFEITDTWGDGICCSWGDGSYLLELEGVEVASGGDFARSEKTCFTAPLPAPAPVPTKQPTTTTGPPPPVAQPTVSPTVGPRAPPEDLVLLSPDELGVTILMHFKADVPAATKFVVEWALAADDWTPARPCATPEDGVSLPPFWDGLRYFTLRDDGIPCGGEVDVRVASVYADGETSAWAEASIVAECAPSPKPTPKPTTAEPSAKPTSAPTCVASGPWAAQNYCESKNAAPRWTTKWCPAPAGDGAEFPACGVRITRGRHQDPNKIQCVTDPAATAHGSKKIAFACCDANTCSRFDPSRKCYAGDLRRLSNFAPKDWHEATNVCAAEGKVLCGVDTPCSRSGCSYDNHYQWTGEECQAGDVGLPAECA